MNQTKPSVQGQREFEAGRQSGLRGEAPPPREKGNAFFGGWLAGNAERKEKETA